jgi:hypothetical protein
LDVLHQTASALQRIGRLKKAFMLSVHNEVSAGAVTGVAMVTARQPFPRRFCAILVFP